MTVDYTQPQQYTPPPPQPPPRKSSGCLKVFLIGCGVLVVIGVAAFAAIVFFVFGLIKKSDVYSQSLDQVRADQRVVAALGEPIRPGFWVRGSLNSHNGSGNADFTFPVSGPKGSANVHVIATTDDAKKWTYQVIDVKPSNGPPINVLKP